MPMDSGLSKAGFAAILYRRKGTVLAVFVLVFATVAAGTFLLPKQYETRIKILVKNVREDNIVSAADRPPASYRPEVSDVQINSEIELLTSNNLLQKVVSSCGLDRSYLKPGEEQGQHAVAAEKALRRLQRDLTFTAVRRADIITVEYVDTDPRRAAAVLSVLAELYMDEHLKLHSTPGSFEFFRVQADRFDEELQNAEEDLAAFRRRKDVDVLSEQKDITLQRAADAQAQLYQTDATILEYERKIADTRRQLGQAQERILTQTRTLTNVYSVERLNTMLAELRNRRSELLVKFRSDDRLVQELDEEIADTRAALEQASKTNSVEQSSDVNPLYQTLQSDLSRDQATLAGEQARRDALARQAGDYHSQLLRLGDATAGLDDLVRKQKEAEDKYLLYSKKAEEARIAESLDQQKISNVTIAETPIEPHSPSRPNIPLNLALGLVFAGFAGVGAGFAADRLRAVAASSSASPIRATDGAEG